MTVIPVSGVDDPRVADYRGVSDRELLDSRGLFIAEGRLVVRRLLTASRYPVRSLLVTRAALASLRDIIDSGGGDLPIYLCDQASLNAIAGYNIHRGCLALGERAAEEPFERLVETCGLLVILEAVGNADNVGGVFRNAAAFGADAVLLTPGCCDPLYRKAIRTSMGAALSVPFAWLHGWPDDLDRLRQSGLTVVALTPRPDAIEVGALEAIVGAHAPVVLLAGAEGAGLSQVAESRADYRVCIPTSALVDSLNVATATGIALHRLMNVRQRAPAR